MILDVLKPVEKKKIPERLAAVRELTYFQKGNDGLRRRVCFLVLACRSADRTRHRLAGPP